MSEYSLEWASTVDPDAGPYSDDDWSDWIRALFQQDRTFQGVIPNYLNGLEASGVASPVTVQSGAAIVDGKRYFSTASENIIIPTPGGATRIDVIVLRKTWASQQVRLTRVAGVEGGGVPAISQADGVTWDIPIAQLSVTTGAVITVTDRRRLAFAAISQKPRQDGRLTLTSGTAITTSDVTGATTVYYTPHVGNVVSLYSGLYGGWVDYNFEEMSIAVPASTDTNYDIFLYDAGEGVLTLETVVWTNDTTRATALTKVDGRNVKSGDEDHLYLGSIRTTGVSGETEDSETLRFVFNQDNQVERKLKVTDDTNSWAYTGGLRQANNSTSNQVEVLIGTSERPVHLEVRCRATNVADIGIGVDTVAANNADIWGGSPGITGQPCFASYKGFPGVGYHYLAWVEEGTSATFYGDNGGTTMLSGMLGYINA